MDGDSKIRFGLHDAETLAQRPPPQRPALESGTPWIGQTARPERWSSTLQPATLRVAGAGLAFGIAGLATWALFPDAALRVFALTAMMGMIFMLAALMITRPQNPLLTITTAAAATLLAAFGFAAVFLASPEHVRIEWGPGGFPNWLELNIEREDDVSVSALIAVLVASLLALGMIIFMIIRIAKVAKE